MKSGEVDLIIKRVNNVLKDLNFSVWEIDSFSGRRIKKNKTQNELRFSFVEDKIILYLGRVR